ncbi:hypothetical protein GEV33_006775 [Tenebrio molitor]|uniref:Uncharacterized protein n=1 Tax=Tenebrio molitor TaxID=7067 RepID=A0A8J6HJE8_TENMO|nr:hypothetical protein GEV33_006775 [Tenebrio molitor]
MTGSNILAETFGKFWITNIHSAGSVEEDRIIGLPERIGDPAAIHCGIGPDNVQRRIKYDNSRRKATSRTPRGSSTLQNLFRTLRSLFRIFEPPSDLFEASSNFSKPLQTFLMPPQTFRRILPVIQPPAPHHLVEAPPGTAPAREEASPDSGRAPPGNYTICQRLDQPTEIKISERGATAPCELPEPGRPPLYKDQ